MPDADELKSRIRTQFGRSASRYATSAAHAHGESLSVLRQWVSPQIDWTVLDVATGAGHTALAFAPLVKQMTAVDLTNEMLTETRRAAERSGVTNLQTVNADATSLPLADGVFDLVLCRLAFHHFSRPAQAAAELARVLRPRGLLALTDNVTVADPRAAQFYNRLESIRDPSHFCVLSGAALHALLEAHGFTVVKSTRLSKEFEFHEWADRQQVGDPDKARLLEMMRRLPDELQPLLQPRWTNDTCYFSLWEQVILAIRD